jgi:lysophospholipase L1-like esterase
MGGHMKLFALAAALVIAACAHAPSHDLGAGARYVNMGSSFAAGAGTGPAPEGSPARCYQSSVSYAHLLAARRNLALTDVSCGGATSAHLLNAWNELPPQIEAITADTGLVTITIGGNDVAYAGNLTQASCEQGEMIRVGTFAVPCPTTPFPVAADAFDNLERNLGEITRQIKTRAPNARVIFIQYVTLAPQTQCANSRFTEAEAAELRATAARLAEVTARAAQTNGADVLRIDEASRDHTPCDADPWSTGLPRDYAGSLAPWHPNVRGMEAIAEQLGALLAH